MNPAPNPAALVAALVAVDPHGLGGVVLRGDAGEARQRWLATLRDLLPDATPWRRMPLHTTEDRLLGGVDLAATLSACRTVVQSGLLAEADGGVLLVAMAERLTAGTAAILGAMLDTGAVTTERRSVSSRSISRAAVVALDEGLADDERAPARLRERLAFEVAVATLPMADTGLYTRDEVADARHRYPRVTLDAALIESLCKTALALGVSSVRAPLLAVRVARACAALDGRAYAHADDAAMAAALVLAPRATQLPAAASPEGESAPQPEGTAETTPADEAEDRVPNDDPGDDPTAASTAGIDERVLEAALASVPPGLLASLSLGSPRRATAATSGSGATRASAVRGRPAGTRSGEPRGGARLNLIETLRAAAPWQSQRRRDVDSVGGAPDRRVRIRREDFQLWRFRQRAETTTVFVVDASGSAALHRLAETKGAVELLLAECYVRRDSVAVIAFRGAGAELLLPPTRSLVRAKRSLAGLPGGGGTPLAAGLDAAHALAASVARRGATPVVVVLTDGRANIARDGAPGRERAKTEATQAARALALAGHATLLLDTSPQPQQGARDLAAAMGARYLPLPHADATLLSQAVRVAGAPTPR